MKFGARVGLKIAYWNALIYQRENAEPESLKLLQVILSLSLNFQSISGIFLLFCLQCPHSSSGYHDLSLIWYLLSHIWLASPHPLFYKAYLITIITLLKILQRCLIGHRKRLVLYSARPSLVRPLLACVALTATTILAPWILVTQASLVSQMYHAHFFLQNLVICCSCCLEHLCCSSECLLSLQISSQMTLLQRFPHFLSPCRLD